MTTAEAAAILQVSRRRVNELIKLGTLLATKPGRDWEVDPASVEAYKNSSRSPGPKRKKTPDITPEAQVTPGVNRDISD